jgi:hypothetical protein
MPILVGVLLGVVVCVFAQVVGLSRDRAFYPTVLIVIPGYYVLFAVMGGSTSALLAESLITCGFAAVATVGFRGTLWLVVAGLAGHGVMDLFHARIVTNPGVPVWWPAFCLAIDLTMAAYLAWLIRRPAPHAPHG